MKRVLIYAAAAIVALASCSKTHVVYKDAPEEIGFKAVTGVMTKDPTNLETTKDLGVFAHLLDDTDTDDNEYFGNTQFQYNTDSWKANKYWPVSNSLIFTVYSPYNGTQDAVSWDATNKVLSFSSGESNNTVNNQTDFLYGMTRPTGSASDISVPVELGHALAKITINVSAKVENVVTLKKLSISQTRHNETCSVNYSNDTPTVTWTTNEDVSSNEAELISENQLTSTPISGSYLVVPEALDDQTITLTYTLKGSEKELTYTTAVKAGETPNQLGTTWAHGKNYIYNISIGPKEIKFSPTVIEWDENTDGVDDNDASNVNI